MILRHDKVKLVANALGTPPDDVIAQVHDHGMLMAALAGSVKHALNHKAAGVDIVICQGSEGGGHTGDVGSIVLWPEVIDAVAPLPVLAAGGIGSGRQMAAAMVMGAAGVWTGSLWLTVEEADVPPKQMESYLKATSRDTVRSRSFTGKPCRLLKNDWTDAWEAPGNPKPLGMPLQMMVAIDCVSRGHAYPEEARDVNFNPAGQIIGRRRPCAGPRTSCSGWSRSTSTRREAAAGRTRAPRPEVARRRHKVDVARWDIRASSSTSRRPKVAGMELHEALYTTRAMRRVRTDPIPLDVQARIMDAAIRAPVGRQPAELAVPAAGRPREEGRARPALPARHRRALEVVYKPQLDAAAANPEAPESIQLLKVQRSAQWLADHFEDVPLYLFPFSQHDPTGGSIYPAVWNAMLAARAEGVGSCLTALLQFFHPAETFEILGVPDDQGWILSGTVSFGYPTGTWGVGSPSPGPRGHLPQHVGLRRRLRGARSPMAGLSDARCVPFAGTVLRAGRRDPARRCRRAPSSW